MTPEELVKQDVIIVDVREKEELKFGTIKDSIHIPMQELHKHIQDWKGKKVVFYCRSGARSGYVANYMKRHGIDAHNLEGGILAYKRIDPSIQAY